uniref:Autophagy-related protein n=1 Tax=Esox lucius TaxID=8010 RepID=A0A6Q2Z883_ESOLU
MNSILTRPAEFDRPFLLLYYCHTVNLQPRETRLKEKDEDGFLYVAYSGENTFGI